MTLNAQDVSFNVLHIVKIRNMKASWHVDASNVKSLDGGEWLKVVPRSHTLVQVIMQGNENIGVDGPSAHHNGTLRSSRGLAKLMQLRNEQQDEDLIAHADAEHAGSCTRFDTSSAVKKAKINSTKASQQFNVDAKASMMLEPEPGRAIKVLRPRWLQGFCVPIVVVSRRGAYWECGLSALGDVQEA